MSERAEYLWDELKGWEHAYETTTDLEYKEECLKIGTQALKQWFSLPMEELEEWHWRRGIVLPDDFREFLQKFH